MNFIDVFEIFGPIAASGLLIFLLWCRDCEIARQAGANNRHVIKACILNR